MPRMPLEVKDCNKITTTIKRRIMPSGHTSFLLLALLVSSTVGNVFAQDPTLNNNGGQQPSQQTAASAAGAPAPPSTSSFVVADPNSGGAQSAYSPPAEPSPILPAAQPSPPESDVASGGIVASGGGDGAPSSPNNFQQQMVAPAASEQQQQQRSAASAGSGGYGALMPVGSSSDGTVSGGTDPLGGPMNDAQDASLTSAPRQSEPSSSAKGRQFNQYAVPVPEPALLSGIGMSPLGGAVPAVGTCPGGASLPIECDPKRPWPQCPPQSYCYATNTVDIGPYFCCPVWSTYGAAWRPATPFYSYAPPPPPNWPEPMRMAAAPYSVRKERKEQRIGDDGGPLMTPEEQRKILQVMNDWVERQKEVAAAALPPATVEAAADKGSPQANATVPAANKSPHRAPIKH